MNKYVEKAPVSEKEQAKEQQRLAILLRTMTNGYMLEVNDEGYMYYSAQTLLEGFLVHVGLERLEAMTREEIKEMLESLKDGSAEKKLQAEITELKALADDQKKQIRELKIKIKKRIKKIKAMTQKIRITSVRNAHGCKIRKCCASCQHKCIESDGTRFCAQMLIKVEQKFKCKQWQMSDGLMNAGKSGGVVRLIGTTEIVID